ncbi:MAG: NADH-ubiquinone oxidoreductase chain M (EC [uncultured Paraburkholderia sp.]|nr:MAG: NADH-ubiquinone oxidoreductase chain M (EC [uncultured Paraburkholderia sp.]CAH2943878.1 MAG: NADH-ubiquinone oxidoreductase chain M (EC [uncultured Paraburkholderia sp.]
MPRFAAFVMLFSMANIGLPGTSGFVGEFMVLMGHDPLQLLDRRDSGLDADSERSLYVVDV